MKKLLTITVLFAVLIGGMVYATDTRVLTMGEMNMVVKDDANIFMFPSTVNYYPKLFLAEIGYNYDNYYYPKNAQEDYDMYKVGGNMAFGEGSDYPWVLGAYFSAEPYIPSLLYEYLNYYDKDGPSDFYTNNRINLLYGRNLGEIPFGIRFNYFNNSNENKDPGADTVYNGKQSLSRYEISLGISPLQKKLDLAVTLGLVTWKITDWYSSTVGVTDVVKPKGNMDFSLSGRYWMNPMGKYVLVPHATVSYVKEGLDAYDGPDLDFTETDKDLTFNLGLGMNYEAEEDVLLAGDVGFEMCTEKYEYKGAQATDTVHDEKWTDLMLPYFKLGLDAKVLSWMDFRAGVYTKWWRDKYTSTYYLDDDRSSYVETQTYLGGGFHWGKLSIDALLDPEFLINGPYFITGNATDYRYEGVAGKVSLLYNF